MKGKNSRWKKASALLTLVILICCVSCLMSLPFVQASESKLEQYDKTTDIGGQLLENREYSAVRGGRQEKIFKGIEYSQNRYNLTINAKYEQNSTSTEDSLRFIVAKAKDTYNNDEIVSVEVVVRGSNIHIFTRNSIGAETVLREGFVTHGKQGELNSYAIHYSYRKLWLYENGEEVFSSLNLGESSRYKDIEPYVGIAFYQAAGSCTEFKLWGEGINYYGKFPEIPSGNGDYGKYIGIKKIRGSSTEFKDGVLKNDSVCSNVIAFTKLPFTNDDTYAWSFEANVEAAEKSHMGIRPILRADEEYKNKYQLAVTDGAVIILYNETEIERGYYDRVLGKTDKFSLLIKPNAVSIWVNDVLVLEDVPLEHELTTNLGIQYEQTQATIRNIKFYYTEPTKFVKPDADPTIPVITSNMYNGAKYMVVKSGVSEVPYNDYTVTHTKGDGYANVYNFENIPFEDNAEYTFRANLNISEGFANAADGPRIFFRTCEKGDIYLAFCKDRVLLLIGTGTEIDSYPMKIETGKTYDVAIHSNPEEASVWIDGKLIFNKQPLSKTGEKTKAKAGVFFERCYATLKNIKIYGNTIVLTDEIFELALHNNPYFNALTVPKKPEGNINHFENVKLSEASLQRLYNDNILRILVSSLSKNYRFKDQNDSDALNGLKKTDTFVWTAKFKASTIANLNLEGAEEKNASISFNFKESKHPSGSNVNYKICFVAYNDKLELQVWQNSTKIKSYEKDDFVMQADKEYTVAMLVGETWTKVWLDGELLFTAIDLPDYQLLFYVSAVNIEAEVYDFDLYKVDSDPNGKVLPVVADIKSKYTGDTLAEVKEQNIPIMGNWKATLITVTSICTLLATLGLLTYGIVMLCKKRKSKLGKGEQ